ncbi:hypothetical protein [Frateuria defendens]|uniref:hypothetical protein n=1 Tax=Frateuria defendens TaxID=2219559 RepID=UPI0012933E09|nr:hypothetical protein [Frateuria defendens]
MKMIGFWSGLVLAAAGTALGVHFAWLGFSSAPYDGRQLGLFCCIMGMLIGCAWACIGALAGYWLKRAASDAPLQGV